MTILKLCFGELIHLTGILNYQSERKSSSHIYFLLHKGQKSVWHTVKSDEIWNFYEGDSLLLSWIDKQGNSIKEYLGRVDEKTQSAIIIPKDCWQEAEPLGEYTLVGCTVAPGFEWEDFSLLPKEISHPFDIPKFTKVYYKKA